MSKKIVTSAASLCRNQCQLSRLFSDALSISTSRSPSLSISSARFSSGLPPPVATTNNTRSLLSRAAFGANTTDNNDWTTTIRRSMATNRKVIDAKNARRLKIQQKKKKNANKPGAAVATAEDASGETADKNSPFLQHQEWVKFQQSITVEGFQTGQTTTATALKKSRGGKQARRKREKELARLGALSDPSEENISAVAQKFPAIRYSPEETEELLKQAYATLPERAGKRGNRNLRRQAERWRRVRKIRSDYKAHILEAHHRRMEARSYKRERTKAAREEAAHLRQKDVEYQGAVLRRWAETMGGSGNASA
ncbi:unnamed protein product [Pseudo-nitzschia multistriata]|uniref:Uncharacterized protein n=1 Tax=Pseudo-nitzschia multistriata TaxID=183589 RepID=A0A448YY38_9STRA|nr:unnamed protein product [Pseudo-nitzschia multistriata]